MEIRNCKKCGRIYNYVVGGNLCPKCKKELDEKFHDVKEYIYNNPGAGVAQVAEEMEVSVAQIKQWVREERLEFAEGSVTDITCESCGKAILSGRYCEHCKSEMVRSFGSMYNNNNINNERNKEENHSGAKMRFLK